MTDMLEQINKALSDYCINKNDTDGLDRIKKIFNQIKALGYSIKPIDIQEVREEYNRFSDNGRNSFDEMDKVIHYKNEAVNQKVFEKAAIYRDKEKQLAKQILDEYFDLTGNTFLVLSKHTEKVIYLNDPRLMLKDIFSS